MAAVEMAARQAAGAAQEIPALVGAPAPTGSAEGTLNTVGLALLAYGLVRLLAKVIDRVPAAGGRERRAAMGLTSEDRRRLERAWELLMADSARSARIQERLDAQQRLLGQMLDQLREVDRKHEDTLRKLRGLWRRIGRRREDGK